MNSWLYLYIIFIITVKIRQFTKEYQNIYWHIKYIFHVKETHSWSHLKSAFDQTFHKNSNFVKYNYKYNCFLYECIVKCNVFLCTKFSASLLQSSVSHDPSEIILIYWFTTQETFLIITNVENSYAAQYFCGNRDIFQYSWIELSKEQYVFETISITFHQIYPSFLYKHHFSKQ